MDLAHANLLADLFEAAGIGPDGKFSERWAMVGGTLAKFHPWVDRRPALGAYLFRHPTLGISWFVLGDAYSRGNFYLNLFPESRTSSTLEMHKVISDEFGVRLNWRYKPTLRDGRNSLRTDIFAQALRSCELSLYVPETTEEFDLFIDELAYIAYVRRRSDLLLAVDRPEPPGWWEGTKRLRLHMVRERSGALVREAKSQWKLRDEGLACSCCGFSFEQQYGLLGADFIEAHHNVPLTTPERVNNNETPKASNY